MSWVDRTAMVLVGWLGVLASQDALAAPPEVVKRVLGNIEEIRIEPERIVLHGSNRQQQLLITATTSDGQQIDVTRNCDIVSSDSTIAAVSSGSLRGVRDGKTTLTARLG